MRTNKKYTIIATVICGIAICACGKSSNSAKSAAPDKTVDVLNTSPVRVVKFLSSDPKGYLNFYAATDYEFGIISSQTNPLWAPAAYAYSREGRAKDTHSNVPAGQSLQIGDLETNPLLRTKSNREENLFDYFGKKTSFKIGSLTKVGTYDENELYIPELIEILSPQVTQESELHPRCDVNNFIVRWNEDPLNENGVIVKIEWSGSVLFGHHRDDSHIILADLFPDTGEATLPLQLFEGIPDTALCELTLIRGNVDAIVVDDYSYKMGGASSETLAFVLLRHIRQKK